MTISRILYLTACVGVFLAMFGSSLLELRADVIAYTAVEVFDLFTPFSLPSIDIPEHDAEVSSCVGFAIGYISMLIFYAATIATLIFGWIHTRRK